MKKINSIYLILSLFALLLLIGAVSATDVDNSITDANSLSVDDSSATSINEVQTSNSEVNDVQSVNESNVYSDSEKTVDNWANLKDTVESSNDNVIKLKDNTEFVGNDNININRNLTIIGVPNSYITGNFSGNIFTSNGNYNVKFINLTFKNINCNIGLQLGDSVDTIENCNFINVTTGAGHTSVLYNTANSMNIVGSNFTNCTTKYGVITNYKYGGNPNLDITGCVFENNYASTEPGAINNCGNLNVSDSVFIKNRANWWAGAIHTHFKAHTIIKNSNFVDNVAGWNGGALYTYSTLEVYNSTFIGNNCTTDNGGGAIGASNYNTYTYNLTVVNSTFINNSNTRYTADNISTANGCGGAISTAAGGYFDVHGSTFVHNSAKIGQAIYASNVGYDGNGTPYLKIYNNTFINHTSNSNDTVYIPNGNCTFVNNIFINSPQTVSSSNAKKYLLNVKPGTILKNHERYYVDVTLNVTDGQVLVVGQEVTITIKVSGLTKDMLNHEPLMMIPLVVSDFNNFYHMTMVGNNSDWGIVFNFNESTISNPVFNYTVKMNQIGIYSFTDTFSYGYGDGNPDDGVWSLKANVNNWTVVKNHGVFNVNYNDSTDKIVVNLTDALGNPLPLTDFKYTIDGVEATATTDENGIAEIDRVIDGKLTIKFNYAGDNTYNGENSTIQIINHKTPEKLATNIVSNDFNQTAVDFYHGERGRYFTVTLKDQNGNVLANKPVSIGFNGVVYNLTTDENGVAKLQINLAWSGIYTFAIAFLGDDNYNGSFVVNKITISPKVSNIAVSGVNPLKVRAYRTLTFVLKGTNALDSKKSVNGVNKKITVKVNGKTYTLKTDKNGKAFLKLRFTRVGTYTITTQFAGDGIFNGKTTSTKIKVIR